MEVICHSDKNKEILENSLDRIMEKVDPSTSKLMGQFDVIVTDEATAPVIYTDPIFDNAYTGGFGAIKGSITYNKEKVHLVVINLSLVNTLNLNEDELDGVVSHEFGHLFNDALPREQPSFLKGHTLAQVNEAKQKKRVDEEVYADYFSKLAKTDKGLLSSIQKYLDSPEATNKDIFETRIIQLESSESFIGIPRPIK